MIKVIEINPANGEVPQLFDSGSRFDMREDRRLRLKGERDESSEAMSLVLEVAKLPEMINALLERFDVPVKHRGCAAASHLVPDAVDIQPFLSAFLSAAKFV